MECIYYGYAFKEIRRLNELKEKENAKYDVLKNDGKLKVNN
tara:strand:+ start:740 stop:862 length:123 start_codon:yes stop_codon:yes gene_type:complete